MSETNPLQRYKRLQLNGGHAGLDSYIWNIALNYI